MSQISLAKRLDIEGQIQLEFGEFLKIREIIADRIALSRSAYLTVFLTDDDRLYAFITAKSHLLLDDVVKMLHRAGIIAEFYFPPIGRDDYFYEMGLARFKQVYPGRRTATEQDLAFYKTLAPYNPALALVRRIKDGRIRTFDTDVKGGWRTYCKYYYNKIKID